MPWSAHYNAEMDLVEAVYSGLLDRRELAAAIAESVRLLRDECRSPVRRLISDCSALEGGHSIAELYLIAQEVAATGLGPLLREAVIVAPGMPPGEHVGFWENTAVNWGLDVRLFDDRVAALQWLREDTR